MASPGELSESPLPIAGSPTQRYYCPGEEYPISRAVHLSRLAAFYPKCRDCVHRNDTAQLPRQTVELIQSTQRRVERKSLFTEEGVRGVYLNELTRTKAGNLAGALASLLWDAAPLIGRTDSAAVHRAVKRPGPAVVIGHDQRPYSPDLVTGVASKLRWMGCQVIDVGLVSKPCFWFAVDHLQALAGVYVTGSGCEPSWSGLDMLGKGAQPYSQGGLLEQVEQRFVAGYSRPTRQAGRQRLHQVIVPYEAALWKHFHALRPLRICYGCPTPMVRRSIEHLFEKLPCRLYRVDVPERIRNLAAPDDPDLGRLSASIVGRQADLGILIDDDGQRCAILDEGGRLVPSKAISAILAEAALAEEPGGPIAIEASTIDELQPIVERWGGQTLDGSETLASMSQAMRTHQALLGGGRSGRFWFRESFPSCDAILTTAKLLQALSRSDAPLSAVASEVMSDG
jgi:phosphomannomutase